MEVPFAIVLGDVNIDIITPPFNPQGLSQGETSIVLDEFITSLGGNAINVAGTLASLKDNHLFLGAIGDCGNSIWIKKTCEDLGIKCQFTQIPNKSAGITFALTYNNGNRQFVATLGTNALIEKDMFDLSIIEKIKNGCHLHRAGFWYTPKLKGNPTIEIFKDVIDLGGETSLDVGWDPEGFSEENRRILYETLNYTNIFFANEKECMAITKKGNPKDSFDELLSISTKIEDPLLVVHRGEKGCSIISRTNKINVSGIYLEKVVNPTGSGDVFNGGFIHGLLMGWDYEKCAKFANLTACVHLSDINKIYPTSEDIDLFKIEKKIEF